MGLALSLNVVLHRANIGRLREIIALAETLGATRLDLANVQDDGWGLVNRRQLIPTREQAQTALAAALAEKQRLADRLEVLYVLPDYYEDRPKPCMNGWGRRYLTVNPAGDVLPCPTAFSIPGLRFENVRNPALALDLGGVRELQPLSRDRLDAGALPRVSATRTRFRRLPLPAALLTGNANATDPVCALTPARAIIDRLLAEAAEPAAASPWASRKNP